jgi:hypothetical protein
MRKYFCIALITFLGQLTMAQTWKAYVPNGEYTNYTLARKDATSFNLVVQFDDGSQCKSILKRTSSEILQPSGYKKEIYSESIIQSVNTDCSPWYKIEIVWGKVIKNNFGTCDFSFRVYNDDVDQISDLRLDFYR